MKKQTVLPFIICVCYALVSLAQSPPDSTLKGQKMYIDVHHLQPRSVTFKDVEAAHEKDLAIEAKYGVHFTNYWVDESKGLVYCLSSASDPESIRKTHAEAHGLLPTTVFEVTDGTAAAMAGSKNLFLDIHELGAGNVTAAAVEDAHVKDLAVQDQYGVNFLNYWIDEKEGVVMCLSEAKNAKSVVKTHKEAHGLLPDEVHKVKQGE